MEDGGRSVLFLFMVNTINTVAAEKKEYGSTRFRKSVMRDTGCGMLDHGEPRLREIFHPRWY